MIYEIVETSSIQYYSMGFFTDKEEAIRAFDNCNEPSDFGLDVDEVGEFEIREHHNGWGSFYRVVKKVIFINKYDEEKDEYVWVKA